MTNQHNLAAEQVAFDPTRTLLDKDYLVSSDFPFELICRTTRIIHVDERHHWGLRSVLLASKSPSE